MLEIFKTNVDDQKVADFIVRLLMQKFPDCSINFDLEDRDKILRIEGKGIVKQTIISFLDDLGFMCKIL